MCWLVEISQAEALWETFWHMSVLCPTVTSTLGGCLWRPSLKTTQAQSVTSYQNRKSL